MSNYTIFESEPSFPETELPDGVRRYKINNYYRN